VRTYEVHVLDGQGSRTLAVSSAIDRHSLALSGDTLHWSQEGKPVTAPID